MDSEPDLEISELVDLGDSGSMNLKPVFQFETVKLTFQISLIIYLISLRAEKGLHPKNGMSRESLFVYISDLNKAVLKSHSP